MNIYILAFVGVLIGAFITLVIEYQKTNEVPTKPRIFSLVAICLFIGMFVPLFNDKVKDLAIHYLGMPKDVNPIIQISSIFGLMSEKILEATKKYLGNKIDKKTEDD